MAASLANRPFGLTIGGILGALGGLFWWTRGAPPVGLLGTALGFLAIALFAPGILLPVNRLWTLFAHRLGILTNYLLLGLFLYVFVTPLGLMIRAFGRDPMSRRFLPEAESYLTAVQRSNSSESLADQF
jgi:hypothetical protein